MTDGKRTVHKFDEKTDALGFLAESMGSGGSSGAIERMEASGQKQLVSSDVLPAEMDPSTRAALESLGFKFGAMVPGDELFQYVEMPPGWSKRASDHAMWSNLVDPQGRKRCGIFYKAAFYDRRASVGALLCRYAVDEEIEGAGYAAVIVRDRASGSALHRIAVTPPLGRNDEERRAHYDAHDRARESVRRWLDATFPECRDPLAYWEA